MSITWPNQEVPRGTEVRAGAVFKPSSTSGTRGCLLRRPFPWPLPQKHCELGTLGTLPTHSVFLTRYKVDAGVRILKFIQSSENLNWKGDESRQRATASGGFITGQNKFPLFWAPLLTVLDLLMS